MTTPLPDDPQLVSFLRQHQSPVPAPALDLEARLLATLPPHVAPRSAGRRWPFVLAIGAAALWGLGQVLIPARQPETLRLATVETHLEESWSHVFSAHAEPWTTEPLP
ncbi:MAG: hypothetical protein IGQ88_07095 [Gloeomargaritaceae cyanobacterium C42_A2020_066]|nr:hypothetical protein [Gloeomargaritaceae cyanobacterium C42_A2020_066]